MGGGGRIGKVSRVRSGVSQRQPVSSCCESDERGVFIGARGRAGEERRGGVGGWCRWEMG